VSTQLTVHRVGPGVTVQDLGRPNMAGSGLSTGGAVDRLAVLEAAALLGAKTPLAGLEMAGLGGVFSVSAPTRFALTGAPMRADINGEALRWNFSHVLLPEQQLTIGAAEAGNYGYLTLAGGIAGPNFLGSPSAHLAAGLGATLVEGQTLALLLDTDFDRPPMALQVSSRSEGGIVRFTKGPQTALFDTETVERFIASSFTRSAIGNRQGARLDQDGTAFTCAGASGLASDLIIAGDIQMTGDGVPYVLLAECQTIGGYPRIGTVIPADLALVAQAPPGTKLRFRMIPLEEADRTRRSDAQLLRELRAQVRPAIRDPRDIPDLLGYQLIGGVTSGDEGEGA
jgi:allophanate hydrolase